MPDFAPHDLTSRYSHQTYDVKASSFFSSLPPFQAFDGTSAYWIGTGGGVDWLQLDIGIGASATLDSYQVQVNSVPEPARAPKDFTLQGSHDGVTWTTLDTRTGESSWTSGETRTYTLGATSAAYQFFRLNITANNGDATYTQVRELYLIGAIVTAQASDFAPHDLTSDSSHSPFVSSASTAFSGTGGFKAFDGSLTTTGEWIGTNSGVDWLALDCGSPFLLAGYAIASSVQTARAPQSWTFEGSHDGSTWNVLDTRTGESAWDALSPETRPYTCATTGTGYRYFRLNITANNGDATYTQVAELFLYGVAGSSLTPQTITFAPLADKLTTDAPFALTATSDSGLTVSYTVTSGPATVSGNTVTLTGSTGTVTIEATQAGDGTYDAAAPVSRSFDVTSPPLTPQTITFPAISNKSVGDAPFGLAATSSSGLAVSYAVTSGPATVAGSTVTLTGAGTVTIEATQAGDGTYDPATPVSRSFTVSKVAQTITFPSIANHATTDPPFSFSPATSSSGLTVSYTILSGPATLAGTTVTLTGPGVVTIQATQAGDGTYDAAPPVSRAFGVFAPSTSGITLLIDEPTLGLMDRTGYLLGDSPLGTSASRGSRATIAPIFGIDDADPYEVPEGAPIFLYEVVDGIPTCTFPGTINDTELDWVGGKGHHSVKINCTSLEQCFDTIEVFPAVAYFNKTRGFIVRDLFARFCTGVPVTLGTISDGGIVISVVYAARERISDIYSTLATEAGFVFYIKPSNQTLQFCEPSTEAAPFTLHSKDIVWESLSLKNTRSDYRNRQAIQLSFAAFSASNQLFQGDGYSTQFALPWPVDQVLTAILTSSTQATSIGSFVGTGSPADFQPDPGDTITITPPSSGLVEDPYTFVTELDNTQRNQVLIGANIEHTCQNLVDAINGEPSKAGITFSLPTWENDCCNAVRISGESFHLIVKNPGSGGNGITLDATGAHFTWSDFASPPGNSTAGGSDGPIIVLNVGNESAGTLSNDVTYTRGSNIVKTLVPVQPGTNLSISYNRLGADCISVEDTAQVALRAALEHGSGKYQQLLTDSSNTDAKSGYLKALQALAANSEIAIIFDFVTDKPLLSPGQLLAITLEDNPIGAPTIVNGNYIIQQVDGALIGGKEKLPEPFCHLRYTVSVVNVPGVPTTIALWENLVIIPHPQSTPVASNSDIASATPTVDETTDPVTGDPVITPTGAKPSAGAGWVQEVPGPYPYIKVDDLVVDEIDDTLVSSASHSFAAVDVGRSVIVISGPAGWIPGTYPITAVAGSPGSATLAASPAPAGSISGYFALVDDSTLCTSWPPAVSSFTNRQILILWKNGLVLTPFSPGTIGYSGDGGDYAVSNANRIDLVVAPEPDDVLLCVYFPDGIAEAAQVAASVKISATITLVPVLPFTPHVGGGASDVDLVLGQTVDFLMTLVVVGTTDKAVIWALNALATALHTGIGTLTASPAGSSYRTYHAPSVMPTDPVVSVQVQAHVNLKQKAEGKVYLLPVPIPPGAPLYVAVANSGSGNRVMTSEDGIIWTEQTSASDADWSGIAFGAGLFVAVGMASGAVVSVMTSPDGIAWTLGTTPASSGHGGIGNVRLIFAGGLFVASLGDYDDGAATTIMTSLDGLTWSLVSGTPLAGRVNCVAFGAGLYVAFSAQPGTGQNIMTSADGSAWTGRSSPADDHGGLALCYGGGQFVAICAPLSGSPVIVIAMTSSDGITWTPQSTPATVLFKSVCYGAGLYVAVGFDAVMTSPDGITWTMRTPANGNQWNSVIYDGGQFVAVGEDSGFGEVAMTSPDGSTWTEQVAPFNTWEGITYH